MPMCRRAERRLSDCEANLQSQVGVKVLVMSHNVSIMTERVDPKISLSRGDID
jgi:hypothetical protein